MRHRPSRPAADAAVSNTFTGIVANAAPDRARPIVVESDMQFPDAWRGGMIVTAQRAILADTRRIRGER